MRRQLTQKDKKEIGTECCNCGSTKELEYHHIIPISLGGNDINSNMVCLCYPCHQKIHYGESKHGLHSTIIKKGLKMQGQRVNRLEERKLQKNQYRNPFSDTTLNL